MEAVRKKWGFAFWIMEILFPILIEEYRERNMLNIEPKHTCIPNP